MRNIRVSVSTAALLASVSSVVLSGREKVKAAAPAVVKALPVAGAALVAGVALSGGVAHADTAWTAPTPPDYLPLIGAVQTYAQTMIATYGPPVILAGVTMGGFRWVAGRVTRIFGG